MEQTKDYSYQNQQQEQQLSSQACLAVIVETNQPGVQLYTGNYLDGVAGKDGAVYEQHAGDVCVSAHVA